MHAPYNFNFLETISQQLVAELEALQVSPLDSDALTVLNADQSKFGSKQGVYLLYVNNDLVYLGKADDLASRLAAHREKISGRQGIELPNVGYKALLLDKSMSTAANEGVLIRLFRSHNPSMWNGKGFGPKDPGQERDTTRPSAFDSAHPIREDFSVTDINDEETIGSLLGKMKAQLPYVFRYDLEGDTGVASIALQLAGVEHTAENLLQVVVSALGAGWKGVILSYGMVLYRTDKNYRYGRTLLSD